MPEKSISQIPRPVREQDEKGKPAFQRQNYDYAITFFTAVLEQEPGFYDCREALRATQFKKVGAQTGFFKKMLSGASSSPMVAKGQMALRNNPHEALKIAEQILTPTRTALPATNFWPTPRWLATCRRRRSFRWKSSSRPILKDQEVIHELAHGFCDGG